MSTIFLASFNDQCTPAEQEKMTKTVTKQNSFFIDFSGDSAMFMNYSIGVSVEFLGFGQDKVL